MSRASRKPKLFANEIFARGWSQQKLADELGYTERYIGQLERGTKSPTLRTIVDIAEVSTMPSTILRAAERLHRNSGKR